MIFCKLQYNNFAYNNLQKISFQNEKHDVITKSYFDKFPENEQIFDKSKITGRTSLRN